MGGEYPTPEEVLLASSLSCLMLTVVYIAREKGVAVEDIEGCIQGDMDPKGFQGDPSIPPGVLEVRYNLTVRSKDPRIKEILEESEKRCPMRDTLARSVKVVVKWDIES
ncbi:OsmC family peroxiredoxin [Sulfolobus metallicus DSM 6482 = JCM 9184]|uniref:OsmC family peroxiredoxin n=2 Tax=Sulfuracidifex metallicus TaxID=47303 RepID=A0A6A9QR48_SULME|nr:OsmC family peroxiredoxin [Sulfuracidifex metallicus DSM 6482 = JCM 9184]